MDSSHMDPEDASSSEILSDSSASPESSDTGDVFGEPIIHPRVGDEYQVQIPPMLKDSELLYLMINPADPKDVLDSSHSFTIGLSVPVMWVLNEKKLIKDETMDTETIEANGKNDGPNKESMSIGCFIAPGLSTDSWNDFELDSFLLGLYMFGKNLLLVKSFVDGKEMAQMLSFYYGPFYGSARYRTWSECRKMRNRKCVIGHRFFTGYRQQELFSRLLPRLSEEPKTKIVEAARAFGEGRTTLYEYVSTLKDLVGIQALVQAVGIGKGKDDLTTLFLDTLKNSQMISNRSEMPSSKACSSLTCPEIVKYLTGDFRLSKARSNDLFWEAVWPRLLARGWHSEQPRGYGYMGSKNCLVFLMPGIQKFSRRKLEKGEHYFDSVSDVLAKVSTEPELLELEGDEKTSIPNSSKEENGWTVKVNLDDENRDSSGHERHCYLKPRVSTELSNLIKFTVVDTSLVNEDNPYRVRELRSLPLEAKKSSTLSNWLRKNETKLEGKADGGFPNDHKSRAIKHQFTHRVKPGLSSCSGQVVKRKRLTSCIEAEVTCILSLPAGKKTSDPMLSKIQSFRGTSKNVAEDIPSEKIIDKSVISKPVDSGLNGLKPEIHNGIDLNSPQLPTDPKNVGQVKVEVEEEKNSTLPHSVVAVSASDSKKEEARCSAAGPVSNDLQPRRQSTRSRPLTTKALEALEIGFLCPVRHYRKRSTSTNTLDQKSKRVRQSKNTMSPSVVGAKESRGDVLENLGIEPSMSTQKQEAPRELLEP